MCRKKLFWHPKKKRIFGRDQWLFAVVISQMDVDTWKRNNCEICDKIYRYWLVWGLEGIVKFTCTLKRIFKISKHTLSRRLVPGASVKEVLNRKWEYTRNFYPLPHNFKHHKHNDGQMAFLNTYKYLERYSRNHLRSVGENNRKIT